MSLGLTGWQALATAAAPVLRALVCRRARAGKEIAARTEERFGHAGLPRPPGRLVWLHAASVGESRIALFLATRLRREAPDLTCLITTGTVTSAAIVGAQADEHLLHQFAPLDHPTWVERFLDHWHPQLAIFIESELWPNLLMRSASRGVTLALVNGRLSPRSARRWRLAPKLSRRLLGRFTLVHAQSDEDAARLEAAGTRPALMAGNLKLAAPPLPVAEDSRRALAATIGARPVWLVASTHAGEEALAARAHLLMAPHIPDLLTILAPRHPARGDEIQAMLIEQGLKVMRRSTGELPHPASQVYLADTLGELGLFFSLSPVTLLGGSLVPDIGGHNPIEPAQLGSALLVGPYTATQTPLLAPLLEAGAVQIVQPTVEDIADKALALLRNPDERIMQAKAGRNAVAAGSDQLDRLAGALLALLPTAAPS